ncbi:PREDICTED: diphthamide biosynthesis protein 1-like [Camelina sativa]|uniref:2-(3-amino-3-carboxypropyl)histidine synthase subunit 1 n=1 Tax=Camelina sativa TaxID=90675 RepID=A0ABM0VLN2_CAMSA|nr:PREDICTED: diphthamide biosynthesis protein 1-like [Camelina sativa]XP_010458080.1 PREDICTED: diphthamide biosynthesis protein 1-like [Camelina sativa]XP_010458087.1 PREDICTED: diphthamide biosynthesis protein 1-like [Camelina sativa]
MELSDVNNVKSTRPKQPPKRFIKNQIPESILNDASLNAAISILPSIYQFEVHKCVWRIKSLNAKRIALQLPEGLLMYALTLSDIFTSFAGALHCFVLGDVTYGACCVDDFSAVALGADLLIHYGHSCLVPIDSTKIPCLYVFVDIQIDVKCLLNTIHLNLTSDAKNIVLAGTIQFSSAIRAVKPDLEKLGFNVLIPQSKPLSAGEVLGCTAPKIKMVEGCEDQVLVFVADGRFHLEAIMIANPKIKAFRYDPYLGKLFLEEYDHKGMRETRRRAIARAMDAKTWGIVLGTLGRQGNPKILERLETKMRENGIDSTVVLMSELSPTRVALFEDSVDAWVQIACPRLSIDWGEAFLKPLLTTYEAEIALGYISGWWEKDTSSRGDSLAGCCKEKNETSCACSSNENVENDNKEDDGALDGDYPMDYYAQEGGEWNSSYLKKASRPIRRNPLPSFIVSHTE